MPNSFYALPPIQKYRIYFVFFCNPLILAKIQNSWLDFLYFSNQLICNLYAKQCLLLTPTPKNIGYGLSSLAKY